MNQYVKMALVAAAMIFAANKVDVVGKLLGK